MKILCGTTNPAKLEFMRDMLCGLDIEIIGLNDMKLTIDPIDENGNNPMDNAKIKALAYYKAAKIPVFSCDSGLYIDGLESEKQPGVYVRRVKGKVLNDEEMIEYYTGVASKLGGKAKAKYKNAICLVIDEKNIFEYDGDDIASGSFLIASKAHNKRNIGFPLDSISLDIETGKYCMDMECHEKQKDENRMKKAYRAFFSSAILK